jgi:signal peptidase II
MGAAPSARWLWLSVAVVAADRATKYAVESFTSEGFHGILIPEFATLVHTRNTGIAFGMFSESDARWLAVALLLISSAVIVLLGWLLIAGRVAAAPAQAGLALLTGGAAGNLLDRLLHGAVTDFVELHLGDFYWPAFNLADMAITAGAVLLVIELVRGDLRRGAAQE